MSSTTIQQDSVEQRKKQRQTSFFMNIGWKNAQGIMTELNLALVVNTVLGILALITNLNALLERVLTVFGDLKTQRKCQ